MPESKFEGTVLGYIGHSILASLITMFTLGIGLPWAIVIFQKWVCQNTVIDGRRLYFDGTGAQVFGNYIKWFFLSIITLGIYGFWLFNKTTNWVVKHTHFAN